ncbi:MAG TPA: MFS transporter, partial [Demequina sp.]|nr:MFS transporter [Demequina sp.]
MRSAPDDATEAPVGPATPVADAPTAGSPLWIANFRRYAGAQLLGSSGVWMLRMASDWLVMELTGSSAAVGLLVALQFFPLMVLGPLGGVLADRHDKRRIVTVAQGCSAVLAATLAVLTLGGWVEVWHLYAMAVLLGLVAAVEQPARQVLVGEVVGDGMLRSAISTNNALNQIGGMIGPAAAGLLISAVGQGWAYATNAIVALAVCALFLSLRRSEMHPGPRLARGRGQVREGVRYVLARPRLAWVMVLAGLMGAFGLNGPVVFTAFAGEWGTGAAGLGLYNTAAAFGALAGAVMAARLARLRARSVVLGTGAFGAVEIVAAVMPVHVAF